MLLATTSSTRAALTPAFEQSLASFRYRVFVEKMKWPLQCEVSREIDQFDRPDTLYVIAQDTEGEIIGCGRLLPTIKPYLLKEVFPDLMGDTPLPCSSEVWELSRFAIENPEQKLPADIAWKNTLQLMRSIIECALAQKATRLIAFSAVGSERLVKRMGLTVHRAAAPQLIDGVPVLPFWIDIDAKTCAAMGLDYPARNVTHH